MARYCPECGIEILTEQVRCPLCQSELQEEAPAITRRFAEKIHPVTPERLSGAEIRRILFAALSLMLSVAIIAVSLVNLAQGTGLSWARYAILGQVAVWVLFGMGLYLYRRPLALLWRCTLALGVLLMILDSYANGFGWSLQLALPVLLLLAALADAFLRVVRRAGSHWALNLASALGALILLCIGVECIVDLYVGVPLLPGWSLIVTLSLAPPVLFLLYIRYRLSKKVDLPKIFHR